MSTRPLPPPIRPRTLKRAPDGFGWVTTDGRYEVTPSYKQPTQGGRVARVECWLVREIRTNKIVLSLPTLPDVRWAYCAPGGKVPWLVCDMDDGVLRVEATRTAAVAWASHYLASPEYRFEHRPGGSSYAYFFGPKGEENRSLSIMLADQAHLSGYDPVQQPLYPFPDDPYEHVARPEPTKESA